MKDLIIVESPSKAKTIQKYLGTNYKVIATKGHIRDLPKSKIGVDIQNHFIPEYVSTPDKKKLINLIKKDIPKEGTVYIASDPDREGEAIGWHISIALGLISENGKLKKSKNRKITLKRIVFHEITKEAILRSFEEARDIDMNLVDAQQGRRILDRLVGYKLSPLLWKKIRYGLSAGRVQSVAVRIVVERERERLAFISKEFWTIDALFNDNKNEIFATLDKIDGDKFNIENELKAKEVISSIKTSDFKISNLIKKQVKRHPYPPFITSTLQQEASRKLNFNPKRTMSIAQKLYEGISTNDGNTALITYMRTDSYNLSESALKEIKSFIKREYGEKYTLEDYIYYKKKSKLAQEAHEAIRPVDIKRTPEEMKNYLTDEQYRLYDLIWKRTLACQMSDAIFDSIKVEITGQNSTSETIYLFKVNAQVINFDGFMKLYIEGKDEEENEEDKNNISNIENLKIGDNVVLKDITPIQHFTQPPARYSEATLIRMLEENGIGRPSTYAPILSTIVDRGYVTKEGKYFIPLDVGFVVNDLLVNNFNNIVDLGFTSKIEEDLDQIANGKEKYEEVLSNFYFPFEKILEDREDKIKKEDVVNLGESDELCPICKGPMLIKLGKYGRFLSCKNFPECKGMKNIDGTDNNVDELCPECNSNLSIKLNSKGIKFLGCSNYPTCKFTKHISTGEVCPKCGHDLVQRKSKWGKFFLGCSNYPECRFIMKEPKKDESEKES